MDISATFHAIVIAGRKEVVVFSGRPAFDFKPQRMTTNVPSVGFFRIRKLRLANICALYTVDDHEAQEEETKSVDAFDFCHVGRGKTGLFPLGGVDKPIPIRTINRISIVGEYSGDIPKGAKRGEEIVLEFSLIGEGWPE